MARISIGASSVLPPDTIAHVASAVEAAGFHGMWINDAGGDAFADLAAAAHATERLVLGVGVIPVDRRTASQIVEGVAALPIERLVLGVGAGTGGRGSLARVADAVDALRAEIAAPVMVGALGPKMRQLAATRSAGPLLSWLPVPVAREQAAEAHTANPNTYVGLYVRAASDERAVDRLISEARRYGSYPNYAANLARLGTTAEDAVLPPAKLAAGLQEYRAVVDELVLRAITPGDDAAEYVRFVKDVAALL